MHTVVTLGSPHAGTALARALPAMVIRQLRPGSALLDRARRPARRRCRTRFLAVWSDLDQLIVPQRIARLEHPDLMVRNLFVRGVGHMSLPIHGRVLHEISTTLAHLGAGGDVLAAGVTPLETRPAEGRPAEPAPVLAPPQRRSTDAPRRRLGRRA